jgi:carboxymethylenebutenolidase
MQIFTPMPDGRPLGLWVENPTTPPKGALIILHEAFGVTPHIQRVCAQYAALGYMAVAPTLFMHATGKAEGVMLEQSQAGLDEGRALITATPHATVLAMIETAVTWAQAKGLPVAIVGYCWGGSCAYAAATHLPQVKACVGYYGGFLGQFATQGQPTCPTLIHLAAQDRYIPLEATQAAFTQHHPAAQVFVYEADHGFNRDDGRTYNPEAAALAKNRTLEVLEKAFV